MRLRPMRASGFTLVELAIAVAIIGVVAALGLSNYRVYIERVRVARAIVQIKAISEHLDATLVQGGNLPNTLAGLRLDIAKDPWGRDYEYLRIVGNPLATIRSRKDQFLVPLNSDYDLYSRGADGGTAATITNPVSLDDVVRGSNGAFIGLARNY
jgi:general secretion pathway protein G